MVTLFDGWSAANLADVAIAAVIGLAWGVAADRLAARWPAHEDGSIRSVDWRTPVVAIVGAVAFAATEARFEGDVPSLVLIGVVVAAMVVLFATDLDQRLLPDLITYPLVALAILAWLVNLRPYVRTTEDLVWAAAAAVGIPFALFLLSIPFGAGAIGLGDLKLLAGVGLLAGALRLFYALVVGAALAGGIVLLLVASRRISLRSYVPYGPFLILGSMWAILALVQT